MAQLQLGHRFGYSQRFPEVELHGSPRGHGAKTAGARTDVSEDHERGGAAAPAVVDVRTPRLLAHRVQAAVTNDLLELLEVLALSDSHPDPGRDWSLLQRRRCAQS